MIDFVPADTANLEIRGYDIELIIEFSGGETLKYVYAKAMQIEVEYEQQPVMSVKQGLIDVPNGASPGYDFGDVAVGASSLVITFTIENLSSKYELEIGSVVITGDEYDFNFVSSISSPVAPLGNTTFTLQFIPTGFGAKSINISILNNDFDQNPYSFDVIGNGI